MSRRRRRGIPDRARPRTADSAASPPERARPRIRALRTARGRESGVSWMTMLADANQAIRTMIVVTGKSQGEGLAFNLVVMCNLNASGMGWVEPDLCFPGVGWLQWFENIVSGVAYADRCGTHTDGRHLVGGCPWYQTVPSGGKCETQH